MYSDDIPIWRWDMIGDCDVIKEDRHTGHLVPRTDSQCPLVRISHQWWDTFSYGAATSVRHCSQSSSVLLGHLHRTDLNSTQLKFIHTRPLSCSCILGPPDDWRRRIGRPRQSWLRTVEADLRPMNLGGSDWRCRSGMLRTDRHGGNSWQRLRQRQAPEEREYGAPHSKLCWHAVKTNR